MSLDKFVQLDAQLKDAQRELAGAKAQIAQVKHWGGGRKMSTFVRLQNVYVWTYI